MAVYFIGAGPGDPDLLTVKGLRLLAGADVVVYAGSLLNPEILKLARSAAELHDSSRLTLEETVDLMLAAAREGKAVVRLHSGDPSLYGAVREQIERLEDAGVACEVVPGVSSFLAAAASLRREYTVPEGSQTLIITRAPGRTPVPASERLSSLAQHRASMCIYLSAHLIDQVARDLLAGGYPPETPVAVLEKVTWPGERVISGMLKDIAAKVQEAGIRRTALILVGDFLASEGSRSHLYHPSFGHAFRAPHTAAGLVRHEAEALGCQEEGQNQGRIWVVGIGPGGALDMSLRAIQALSAADVIVGYRTYLDLIPEYLGGKVVVGSEMTEEVDRCREALDLALSGKRVAVVSSGDPGIYGMAGLILELVCGTEGGERVPIEVIPGITAASAAASLLGAPLMNDFAVISLSDLMTPWRVIEERLQSAAAGDLVTVLYNPRSRKRTWQLEHAREIFLRHRGAETPVGIVRAARREGERVFLSTLGDLPQEEVDMLSTVIIGNSQTRVINGRMVTPRGYVI